MGRYVGYEGRVSQCARLFRFGLGFFFPFLRVVGWDWGDQISVVLVCVVGFQGDADVGGYRSSTPMASIRMTGSKFAARKSGGSRLVRWSIWYVPSDTRRRKSKKWLASL